MRVGVDEIDYWLGLERTNLSLLFGDDVLLKRSKYLSIDSAHINYCSMSRF